MNNIIAYHDRLGYRIPKKYSNLLFYKKIKNHLTLVSHDYHTQEVIEDEYFYESKLALLLPRLFPIEEYIDNIHIDKIEQWHNKKIKIKSKVKPRDEVQKDSIKHLLHNPNALLQLSPGSGKTIIAIDVLCTLKYKTIILVHRGSLLEQWHDRLQSFSDISAEKIGFLSTKTYARVLKESDVILSTVQAFNAIMRNPKHTRQFQISLYHSGIGLMIGDEVHSTVGAPKFSMASLFVPCHRTIGLSATPDKEDGSFKIIKYHLGEVYESKYESSTLDAEVNVIVADFGILKGRERWLNWKGKFQYGRYYQILKNSKIFMGLLSIIIPSLIDDNRDIVLMAERIKLIDELMVIYKDYDCFSFIHGVKNDCLSHKLIFTTPGKMRDGIDVPWKDTLILTSPVKNINQATGRIVRICKGKKTPLVIDMVDMGVDNISSSFFRSRLPFYDKKEWVVKYFALENDVLTQMGKDKAIRLAKKGIV